MATGIIFPSHVYGQLSDKYGLNISAYNNATTGNTTGFPPGSGLQLGQVGILFDGTTVRMLKASNTINQSDFAQPVAGNSNDYTVQQLANAANQVIQSCNDRVGGGLVANDFAWMTVYGLGTGNVAAATTAGQFLVSGSGVAGRAQAALAGTSLQANVILLNTTTTAGAYPVKLI